MGAPLVHGACDGGRWSPTGKPVAPLCFADSLAPLCFADSLCERRDLVVRHPARPIPLYLNPCDGRHSSTAKAVAFCERGKVFSRLLTADRS